MARLLTGDIGAGFGQLDIADRPVVAVKQTQDRECPVLLDDFGSRMRGIAPAPVRVAGQSRSFSALAGVNASFLDAEMVIASPVDAYAIDRDAVAELHGIADA